MKCKRRQGGILGQAVNYLIQNFSRETLIIQERNAVKDFLSSFGKLTLEEHKYTKLVLLSLDNVLVSVISYYMMWGYVIAKYASGHYFIQFSGSDITVQLLADPMLTEVVKGF